MTSSALVAAGWHELIVLQHITQQFTAYLLYGKSVIMTTYPLYIQSKHGHYGLMSAVKHPINIYFIVFSVHHMTKHMCTRR